MKSERERPTDGEEQRNYFRVDDVISVVANPVSGHTEKDRESLKKIMSSKSISLLEDVGLSDGDENGNSFEYEGNERLYEMVYEIKSKLDFIINHFLLEKEGLLAAEKREVNISASGIRFTIDRKVSEGDILEIKLLLPTYPPVAVFAYGEVKRVKALDDSSCEVALEYLNMNESVRNDIIQYTLSNQREIIRRSREKKIASE